MKSYKVFYHSGDELGLKTRVKTGTATVSDFDLKLHGSDSFSIPLSSITSASIFRLHGLGRVIQIDHKAGRIFVSVTRLMIGQFALINFVKTGELQKLLQA